MARELKEIICGDLKEAFADLDGCVLIDYRGLNSEQTADLRAKLAESGVQMNVIPNRLARRVFGELGVGGDFCDLLKGPTAVLFGGDGAFTASKSLSKWKKENEEFAEIRGGLFQGKALSPADVHRLATIPEPDVLRSNILGLFLSPATHISSCAGSLVSHLAGCVKAHHDSQS